jgi:hypothetical protein
LDGPPRSSVGCGEVLSVSRVAADAALGGVHEPAQIEAAAPREPKIGGAVALDQPLQRPAGGHFFAGWIGPPLSRAREARLGHPWGHRLREPKTQSIFAVSDTPGFARL